MTHPLLLFLFDSGSGEFTELLVGTFPKFRVDLVLRNKGALEQMTHKEVVVHRLGDNLSDRLGSHFDVGVMTGSTGLKLSAGFMWIRTSSNRR